MKRRKIINSIVAISVLIALILTLSSCFLFTKPGSQLPPNMYKVNTTSNPPLDWMETVTSNSIGAVCIVEARFPNEANAGSGFLISSNGYIATNYHVVADANNKISQTIRVKFLNAKYLAGDKNSRELMILNAKYVDGNIANDIAVLKISDKQPDGTSPWHYLEFGDSDQLVFGRAGLVIGNPSGVGISVAEARVANPYYIIEKEETVGSMFYNYKVTANVPHVQLDANINHGNSGGPFIDVTGKVQGIVSLRRESGTQSPILGIGFAITSNRVKEVIRKFNIAGLSI